MPVRRTLLTTACLAALLLLTACAGGSQNGASPASPSTLLPPPAASTAILRVQVDSICAGRETQIQVFIDAALIGVTNPGEPSVAKMVPVGGHQLSAVSLRGTRWGPLPTTVTANGVLERLGCMPADGI